MLTTPVTLQTHPESAPTSKDRGFRQGCPAIPYPLYGLASFTSTVSVYAS